MIRYLTALAHRAIIAHDRIANAALDRFLASPLGDRLLGLLEADFAAWSTEPAREPQR